MSLLMTVIFEDGFAENYFPNTDNRKFPISVRPYISGLKDELQLNVEVWDGIWTIKTSSVYSLTYKGDSIQEIKLEDGIVLEGMVLRSDTVFSVKVDEINEQANWFDKYIVKTEKVNKIDIGSNDYSMIVFKNRFVTEKHAEITYEGDNAYIADMNSVNGTFLNGRLVTGKTKLCYGDVIYVVGLKIVYMDRMLAINNPDGNCKVREIDKIEIPKYEEEDDIVDSDDTEENYFLRTPRRLFTPDTEKIVIEKAPKKQKQKRQPIIFTIGPSFTMVIPIALAAVMSSSESGLSMGSLVMSVGAAAIGTIWAIVNVNYSKKEEAESEHNRVEHFVSYIVEIENILKNKAEYNKNVLVAQYPSSQEMLHFTTDNTRRLWEKSSTHADFLSIRAGSGDIGSPNQIETAKEEIAGEHDPLNDKIYELAENYRLLKDVPVAVSLLRYRMVGLVSEDENIRKGLIRNISLQITAAHPYNDVRLCYVFPGKDLEDMEYAKWLPHTKTPDGKLRMLTCDKKTVGDVMYFLSSVIRERMEESEKKKEEENTKVLPHYVIIISDISLVQDETIFKFLMNPPKEVGLSVIVVADAIDKIPANCTTIIQKDSDITSCYNTLGEFQESRNLVMDEVSQEQMDTYARELSNFTVREAVGNSAIPDTITFLDMYKTSKVEELDMYHKWLENRTYESMRSMIGYKAGNQPLYLDIHEKYHGPHGLVAGTTGSGKSETLQSYILSLVVNYHPHEVSFILIDYKGGGMAQSFEGLPHLAGMITNLGGNQTNRALLSINAEIKRRQRIFNEYKIKHIDAYIELYRNGEAEEPMPHLLIIADEFAELKKEQPDFVRALVSAARVGRSLGVNLILATQKPSGVVDDEIWSNTRFRLCLRVADKQDSNEMLKRTDAAYITGTGRGFLQVGNDEIFEEFQSGWSGAPYTPEEDFNADSKAKAEIINLIGKAEVIKKKKKGKSDNIQKFTQLDAVVKYAAKVQNEQNIAPLKQIWLPPLPKMLCLEDLDFVWNRDEVLLPIGLCDDPENQRQFTVFADFVRDGHMIICGSSGSGKTTLVETMLYGAATAYGPNQINFYIADFSSRTLPVFGKLPHTGCVCMEGDDEKIEEMITFLQKNLSERKKKFAEKGMGSFRDYNTQYKDFPILLFVVDNYAAFADSYDQYEDAFVQFSREAASYGIYMIITCNNAGDVRSRITQNITCGIGLQLPDRFEYDAVLGTRSEIMPEDKTTGRGLIKVNVPLEFQAALPVSMKNGENLVASLQKEFEEIAGKGNKKARKIGNSIESISYQDFINNQEVKAAG